MGGGPAKTPVGAIDSITVQPSWFWHRLTIRLGDGTERSVGGLDEREAVRVRDAVIASTVEVARALSPHLKRLDERRRQQFAGDHYVRYSDSRTLHEALARVPAGVQGANPRAARPGSGRGGQAACTPRTGRRVRGGEAACELPLHFEEHPHRAGSRPKDAAAPSHGRNRPKPSATDEDATLVLAGAGTGKTSVIVGKVAHLVRNQHVSPDEVLVLAFNRNAADEIRGRLMGDLSEAHVHTFHSFGRRVIAESEVAPTISKLAEDNLALRRAVDDIIVELLNDPEQSKAVIDFIVYHYAPYRSAFEFDTLGQYEEYVRGVETKDVERGTWSRASRSWR